ncbi:MAG: lipoate--protein ligase [Oscillospiraceae bacterium]|nr:lipoate--protein ligase [Oscillospiraceae bacterium]
MIERISLFQHDCLDPYRNLAVEEYLLDTVEPGQCILYLWQNENTVVIGRNQNAWKECRTSVLEQEGGHLARRLSGGGAVFHDRGNLNFTFLVREEDYDLDRQLSVIQSACKALGLEAERSGRNDVLVDGRKFSGNAFYHSHGKAYHHGTVLVDTDGEKMARYLSPSKAKLQAKGVESVRARVVNLIELVPDLTCARMAEELAVAFEQVYGMTAQHIDPARLDWERIEQLQNRNASADWLYGPRLPLTFECEERFSWGSLQLQVQVESGVVVQAKVYSDAMDWDLAPALERALTGSRFLLKELQERVQEQLGEYAADLCAMLARQEI